MSSILRNFAKTAAVAALLALGTGAANAQVWPTASPYTCDWTLGSTSGKSFVTFLYDSPNTAVIDRTGSLRTVYPSGSSMTKRFTLSWEWAAWDDYHFYYVQDQPDPQPDLTCEVLTANGGRDVTFYSCSNGAWQHCVQ
jgi:hypothetical protein